MSAYGLFDLSPALLGLIHSIISVVTVVTESESSELSELEGIIKRKRLSRVSGYKS